MKPDNLLIFPLAVLGAALLAGCSGQVSVGVTDAPVDNARRVVIQFDSIDFKPQSGSTRSFDIDGGARQIDVLSLQGGQAETLLDATEVSDGSYDWMQLHVSDNDCASLPPGNDPTGSFIELNDGSIEPLHIPDGSEAGLKTSGFSVSKGDVTAFTIDFDIRKSIVKPDGQSCYYLKPHIRLVNNDEIGTIAGSVDASALNDSHCDTSQTHPAAVYLFTKPDSATIVTPSDVDGVAPDPVTSALLTLNTATGQYDYAIGFVLPGNYVASLTCDADIDDPETADTDVKFLQSQEVNVAQGTQSSADFPVP